MLDYSSLNPLPRRDLREPAFRKFERDIARACNGSVIIDPNLIHLKATTYVARFRDAIKGFTLYKYPSLMIPAGYDLRLIKAVELASGQVHLQNPKADADKLLGYPSALSASDLPTVIAAIQKKQAAGQRDLCLKVAFATDAEFDALENLMNTIPDLYVMRSTTPGFAEIL